MLRILLGFRRETIAPVSFPIEFCFLGCGIPKTFDVPTSTGLRYDRPSIGGEIQILLTNPLV